MVERFSAEPTAGGRSVIVRCLRCGARCPTRPEGRSGAVMARWCLDHVEACVTPPVAPVGRPVRLWGNGPPRLGRSGAGPLRRSLRVIDGGAGGSSS